MLRLLSSKLKPWNHGHEHNFSAGTKMCHIKVADVFILVSTAQDLAIVSLPGFRV